MTYEESQKFYKDFYQNLFEEEIRKIHPDVLEIINSTDFKDWLKKQSNFLKLRFANTNDPEEAVEIITYYKKTFAPSEESNQSERREVVDAQQDIIKGFIKLAKLSEGYRQHNEFESISTLFVFQF